MEDIISSPPSPNPLKRHAPDDHSPTNKLLNLKGTQFVMSTPPDTDGSSNASPQQGDHVVKEASPAPSSSALSSIQEVTEGQTPSSTTASGTTSTAPTSRTKSGQPPAKRRKILPAEKLEQQRVKEAKAAEKMEKKARKEKEKQEEQRQRDEKKRLKDEETRKKAEDKEQKKREKELEEERKNQAKMKKERSQMRLQGFLRPAPPAQPSAANDEAQDSEAFARRRSLSLEAYDTLAGQIGSASPARAAPPQASANATPSKPAISDYRKHFLPFQAQSHTTLIPSRARIPEDQERAQGVFDSEVHDQSLQEKCYLGILQSYASIKDMFPDGKHNVRGLQTPTARQVVEQIHGNSSNPIDLTDDKSSENPLSTLQTIPYRYLHFHEDVRPPYYGTYSKHYSPAFCARLRRNPFARERKDTDYNYDSECEWEEPEEGEDLGNDEDDETESNGDVDEMDGFLDDEDDVLKNKRKVITGDLVPVSTGLCWANEAGRIPPRTECDDMKGMRLGFLLPGFTGQSVDPFSSSYWEQELMPPPGVPVKELFWSAQRPPLKERQNSSNTHTVDLVGASQGEKGPITSVTAAQGEKRGRKLAPKTLSKEDLDEFKDAVVGSGLGKIDLCKGLKARFPKISNDVIKDTLGSHFAQVGTKREEKKWVFVSSS